MMKKLISILAAFCMFFAVAANAQTVQKSAFFENIYVSANGGVTTTGMFSNIKENGPVSVLNGLKPVVGLELGKYMTPSVGFSFEGLGFICTTTSNTIFDESVVLANGKLNLSNWIAGYKGQPRRIEFVGVLGIGWGHDYVGNNQIWSAVKPDAEQVDFEKVYGIDVLNEESKLDTDKNYEVYRAGGELNMNLGKARAWQISLRPGIMWFNKVNKYNQSLPRFESDARAYLTAGLVYKFGSKKKQSHNFVLCPYSVTQAEYDELLAKYNEVKDNPKVIEKETIKETVVIKEVPVEKTNTVYNPMNVTFAMGSAELTDVEKAKIEEFVDDLDVKEVLVVGSADSKTGTVKRNQDLASKRANIVAKYLEKLGIKVKTETTMDVNRNSAEASRAAIIDVNSK